ncbi:MAG: c-type cytochrome [Acidobacteriota bacterium]|nr:MAG: c-type cytochrome [Acidobacteriota bacterium]
MKKNKYLLLISSLGVFALLVYAAVSENFFKEWHSIQAGAKTSEGPLDVRLRQIINPSLGTTDRCVTCHIGMAPGETVVSDLKVAAPHPPVVHSPTEMGCTTCHSGQGLATEKLDAHGDVEFWPEPMLSAKYAYASCGTCHVPLEVPNSARLELARKTFERLDCYACHRLDGRGGTLRPSPSTGMEGPDLSHTGIKGFDANWYPAHLAKKEADTSGLWANSFGEVNDADRALLDQFLGLQMGAPLLIRAKAEYNSVGCTGCHVTGNFGGETGVDLSRVGEKDPNRLDYSAVEGEHTYQNWIAQHFRLPLSTVQGSQMPDLALSEPQIDLLTMYVLSLRRRSVPDIWLPKDRVRAMRFGAREFASDGETIFKAVCSSCHGADGKGVRYPGLPPYPSITNTEFLELASDDFIAATIKGGRPGRPMLAWGDRQNGFTAEEISAVVAYIRAIGGGIVPIPDTRPARWAAGDAKAGNRLFLANCAGCHGSMGEGGEGPALNNPGLLNAATDTFLFETIARGRSGTVMKGFRIPSPTRRALTDREIESVVTYLRSLGAKQKRPGG